MRLALYQPDIPQNLGAAIRVCACLGAALDVIEPCGFPLTDKSLKRAALDYGDLAVLARHAGFAAFLAHPARGGGRLVLVETDGAERIDRFSFARGDTLILGRESAGAPLEVRQAAAASVRIPMADGARSLNVVTAGTVALYEAMRQTGAIEDLEAKG
ncbi:MAG: tRNA (cytidine(34)-2'-O)-methyltransferase [Alphaproteobacteria bacterium]|nr:tRNA (cytidine(34)-2'-O)-methyltransferase [Alphaproteobacteria bacterium]